MCVYVWGLICVNTGGDAELLVRLSIGNETITRGNEATFQEVAACSYDLFKIIDQGCDELDLEVSLLMVKGKKDIAGVVCMCV